VPICFVCCWWPDAIFLFVLTVCHLEYISLVLLFSIRCLFMFTVWYSVHLLCIHLPCRVKLVVWVMKYSNKCYLIIFLFLMALVHTLIMTMFISLACCYSTVNFASIIWIYVAVMISCNLIVLFFNRYHCLKNVGC
jgi:hypothetical protein